MANRTGQFTMGYHLRTNITRAFIYLFLSFLVLLCIVPLWILFINATRNTPEIQSGISLIPSTHFLDNYRYLVGKSFNLVIGFVNSMYLSLSITVLSVYFSTLTAYAITVYNFRGREFLKNFVYALVLIPQQVSIIGFFGYMAKLGLTDTYYPLILPAIASAGSVFFARQYLETCVIKDLIFAARVDGCSEFGIFHKIMVPIAKPGMYTMAIFSFVGSWNNLFTPTIMLTSTDKYTLPMLVQLLRGDMYRTEYGAIYFGLFISVIPVILIYSFLAKYIVSGLTLGAVKE